MKGYISIFLLIVFGLASYLYLLNFSNLSYGIFQQRDFVHQQATLYRSHVQLIEHLQEQQKSKTTKPCVQSNLHLLCHLQGISLEEILESNQIRPHHNLILPDQKIFKANCPTPTNLATPEVRRFIHPDLCQTEGLNLMNNGWYDYNLAVENAQISNQSIVFINGFLAINQLSIYAPTILLAIDDVTIDNIEINSQTPLFILSWRGKIIARHYPDLEFKKDLEEKIFILNAPLIGILPNWDLITKLFDFYLVKSATDLNFEVAL